MNTGAATELHHVIEAYEAVTAWGADVVHDHTLVGPVYAERFDVPVVTTNHGPFDGELGALYQAIGDRVAVVAISRSQASASRHTSIAAVIHHGLDLAGHPVGCGRGGYAVFLGRMSADKGVDVAARVARTAGMPLRIAAKLAEPAEREFFRARVEPLLGDDIEYVGEVGGHDKGELLGGAVCLLNPLQWAEPFGMVMIEALAAGTPVVATRRGSVPEIVDHGVTGFICDTEAELTSALSQVARLDRSACRRAVAERFTLERMVADHLELFGRLVSEGRRPRRVA